MDSAEQTEIAKLRPKQGVESATLFHPTCCTSTSSSHKPRTNDRQSGQDDFSRTRHRRRLSSRRGRKPRLEDEAANGIVCSPAPPLARGRQEKAFGPYYLVGVGRQAWAARVGTGHSHAVSAARGRRRRRWPTRRRLAHRPRRRCRRGTRLNAGQLLAVELRRRIAGQGGFMGHMHVVSVHRMGVPYRMMMMHRGRR
jgi:hypothetical protein